jgi:hypothetical protein
MKTTTAKTLRRPSCSCPKKRNLHLNEKVTANRCASLSVLNARFARAAWGPISKVSLHSLMNLTDTHGLSVAAGDLQYLDGRWTHPGLLRIAQRNRCFGISAALQRDLCNPTGNRWVFKAIVYKSPRSKGFVGYGDADPSNVSQLVRGAEMRVAETRAVNRALRKAYGIGLCSIEELSWSPRPSLGNGSSQNASSVGGNNGHPNGQPRLRDRLCLLIRQHGLDANLVKAYASDYCGTATLREASRNLVEAFINDLAEWAAKDREGLLCHLNSYAKPEEAGK